MGILKNMFKVSPFTPYTMLLAHNIALHKFCSFFLNIVKGKKGKKQKLVKIVVFLINFVTDCYSRSTPKTHPLKLLLLYFFDSKSLGSIHFNLVVGENLDIA